MEEDGGEVGVPFDGRGGDFGLALYHRDGSLSSGRSDAALSAGDLFDGASQPAGGAQVKWR
jgi:hypothetical protein